MPHNYSRRVSFSFKGASPAGVLGLGGALITPDCDARSFETASPTPYCQYCQPRYASQHAWKMPHSLNASGILVVALKNQNIFMASPASQFASTDNLKPLHDLVRSLESI